MLKKRVVTKVFICLVMCCNLVKSAPQERIITFPELEAIKQQQNHPPQQSVTFPESTHGAFSNGPENPPLKKISSLISPSSLSRTLPSTHQNKHSQLSFEETFWWHLFPLTGLFFVSPHYPYLPHAFSVWQLAPSLGAGIMVTFIDTGVFGWNLTTKGGTFARHPNSEIEGNFLRESWNTCPFADRSVDPLEDLVAFVTSRTKEKDTNQIRQVLPLWIEEFLSHRTTHLLDTYLQEHGLPDLFITSGNRKEFSTEGKRVKHTLTHKEQGFGQFTLVTLASGAQALCEFMPLPSVPQTSSPFISKPFADHATHTTSIVGARFAGPLFRTPSVQKKELSFGACLMSEKGLSGLAPRSQIRVIKALQEGADTTHVTHISNALARAALYGTDIVNLSLRIDEVHAFFDKRFQQFEEQCAQFPFLCCAAGNDRKTKQGTLGYPARSKNVFFSVGSFGCTYNPRTKTYDCHLSPFSQYEEGVGPHFVAPGEAILGCSSVIPGKDPFYALHTGTSYATAYLTGCLTLILGEHKNSFSPQEIMTVCQNSCFRLYDTVEWNKNVTYGVLDVRTALFTLHVLTRLQKRYGHARITQNFKKLVTAITDELLTLPTLYAQEKKLTISFTKSFIDYYNTTRTFLLPDTYQKQVHVSLEDALEAITKRISAKNHFLSAA